MARPCAATRRIEPFQTVLNVPGVALQGGKTLCCFRDGIRHKAGDGLGCVADSQADDLCIRALLDVCIPPLCNLRPNPQGTKPNSHHLRADRLTDS